jgi:hypothetical protein
MSHDETRPRLEDGRARVGRDIVHLDRQMEQDLFARLAGECGGRGRLFRTYLLLFSKRLITSSSFRR